MTSISPKPCPKCGKPLKLTTSVTLICSKSGKLRCTYCPYEKQVNLCPVITSSQDGDILVRTDVLD